MKVLSAISVVVIKEPHYLYDPAAVGKSYLLFISQSFSTNLCGTSEQHYFPMIKRRRYYNKHQRQLSDCSWPGCRTKKRDIIVWPSRSPYIALLDYFTRDILKDKFGHIVCQNTTRLAKGECPSFVVIQWINAKERNIAWNRLNMMKRTRYCHVCHCKDAETST